jgi:flagellar M-ring protein FliF
MGGLQRLSVAVLVDGTWEKPAAGSEETEPSEPVYTPRSAEELTQIGDIVKGAVGFNPERGDRIEVQNLPFRSPLDDVAAGKPPFWERPELFILIPGISRTLAILMGISLLIFLVIRPALKQLTLANIVAATSAAGGAPGEAGDEVKRLVSDAERLREQLSSENPKLVADTMKQLLRE